MSKNKILIIDDEADIIETLTFRLETNDYEIISALTGENGIQKAKEESPDLIILDLMLPEMFGTDVSNILASDASTKNIPIIFLTALQTPKDEEVSGHKFGDSVIFAKPFDAENLLKEIEKLLKK